MYKEPENSQIRLEAKLKEQAVELITLKQQLEQLEHILTEKIKEIRESQYETIQSEKISAIAQLASGVGHELRNPLGIIKASAYFLKMMLGEDIDKRVLKHVGLLENAVSASDRIIADLMEFARPGQTTIIEVNINQLIKETLESITIPDYIEASYNLSNDLPSINAGANQLKQVFNAIINNAIQAMPEQGTLSITTKSADSCVEVTISDTGLGIKEEDLPRIFEPLFTAKAKGIGLGLSLVKRNLGMQGGSISVTSQLDKGSTFTVKLPFAR
ncbi:sensor histidine kinase [Chloroflexota bacterium]